MNSDKDLRAIIYTDGSTAPTNPGKSGAGIHGYIYDYNNNDNITINKPSRFIVTNNGYKDLDSAINSIKAAITFKEIAANKPQGFSFIVNPIDYIEGLVSLSHATNNVAELVGALEAVKFIVNNKEDYPINHVTIFTDSGYAINAFNKIHDSINEKYNYWLNRPNFTQLREIESALKLAMANNIKVELRWIKGHAGSIGNVKADMMADIGRKLPTDDISVKIDFYNPKEYYGKLSIDNYISDNMDKLIFDKCLNAKSLGYTFGFKKKVDKTVAGKGLKHNSYVMVKPFSVAGSKKITPKNITKEANKIAEELIELSYNNHFKFIGDDKKTNLTAVLNLEELIKGDSYSYLNRYGAECAVELIKNRIDLSRVKAKIAGDVEHHDTIADIYYSPEIEDEMSRYNVIQYVTVEPFIDMLMQIHSGSYGFRELKPVASTNGLDITDSIYKDNKLVLKNETLHIENDDLVVNLVTGINVPDLNLLKKYEKKVELVQLNIMSNGRIFIVFHLEDAVIVYFNPTTIAYYKTGNIKISKIDTTVHRKTNKKKKK